jgi:hypothetical protein
MGDQVREMGGKVLVDRLLAMAALCMGSNPELEFLNNLWGLGTEQVWGYRTGPPDYKGLRN